MARPRDLPSYQMMDLLNRLDEADCTMEELLTVMADRCLARSWVRSLRLLISGTPEQLRGIYDVEAPSHHMLNGRLVPWGDVLKKALKILNLRPTLEGTLKGAGIRSLADLLEYSEDELGHINQIGITNIGVVKTALLDLGLRLSDHEPEQSGWVHLAPGDRWVRYDRVYRQLLWCSVKLWPPQFGLEKTVTVGQVMRFTRLELRDRIAIRVASDLALGRHKNDQVKHAADVRERYRALRVGLSSLNVQLRDLQQRGTAIRLVPALAH